MKKNNILFVSLLAVVAFASQASAARTKALPLVQKEAPQKNTTQPVIPNEINLKNEQLEKATKANEELRLKLESLHKQLAEKAQSVDEKNKELEALKEKNKTEEKEVAKEPNLGIDDTARIFNTFTNHYNRVETNSHPSSGPLSIQEKKDNAQNRQLIETNKKEVFDMLRKGGKITPAELMARMKKIIEQLKINEDGRKIITHNIDGMQIKGEFNPKERNVYVTNASSEIAEILRKEMVKILRDMKNLDSATSGQKKKLISIASNAEEGVKKAQKTLERLFDQKRIDGYIEEQTAIVKGQRPKGTKTDSPLNFQSFEERAFRQMIDEVLGDREQSSKFFEIVGPEKIKELRDKTIKNARKINKTRAADSDKKLKKSYTEIAALAITEARGLKTIGDLTEGSRDKDITEAIRSLSLNEVIRVTRSLSDSVAVDPVRETSKIIEEAFKKIGVKRAEEYVTEMKKKSKETFEGLIVTETSKLSKNLFDTSAPAVSRKELAALLNERESRVREALMQQMTANQPLQIQQNTNMQSNNNQNQFQSSPLLTNNNDANAGQAETLSREIVALSEHQTNFAREHQGTDGDWDDENSANQYDELTEQIKSKIKTLIGLNQGRDTLRDLYEQEGYNDFEGFLNFYTQGNKDGATLGNGDSDDGTKTEPPVTKDNTDDSAAKKAMDDKLKNNALWNKIKDFNTFADLKTIDSYGLIGGVIDDIANIPEAIKEFSSIKEEIKNLIFSKTDEMMDDLLVPEIGILINNKSTAMKVKKNQ